MLRLHLLTVCTFSLLAACGGDDPGTSSEVQGVARYRDAMTEASGAPHQAEAPPAQDATITVTVRGTGTLSGVEPTCLDQAAGQFHAVYAGEAAFDGSGGYVASMASATALLQTPSGCTIPDLTVGVATDIVVRAELDTTTTNCDTYCSAHARAEAESQCDASPDVVACRASAESSARAACQTECTTQRQVIVAEATIGGSSLGELDGEALRAAALGEITANLTFETLE